MAVPHISAKGGLAKIVIESAETDSQGTGNSRFRAPPVRAGMLRRIAPEHAPAFFRLKPQEKCGQD